MFSRAQVRRVLQRVPGKQRLGVYRFLPFFFVLGGTMEWIMIKVRVGQETFYDVYRRKASERQYQRRLEDASETELQQSINVRASHCSGFSCCRARALGIAQAE
ncbi:ubiquinol-cytochrome-c reductase complex assembly factor 5 isoform X2 [Balaenoptera ricei]|uniref:ubiquinol-cytochrome-c reductase complex assembly factor 5 isoform X2 n=1 Tax=Balaenoptera ricei TaxID=2746895 RepID=UPI0028BE2512|nr:ubiquinol-cytochrome-c reductase complex assembly factor 5 isoform X2 [Balaenoptera ricei]